MQQVGTMQDVQRICDTSKIGEIFISYGYLIPREDLTTIRHSEDIINYLREKCFNPLSINYREESYAIFLNRANLVIGWHQLSVGGITGTVVDPRVLLTLALGCGATSIVLAHNHPSGSLKPSRADEAMTEKIRHCCAMLDIALLDHLILSDTSFFSFADNGLI